MRNKARFEWLSHHLLLVVLAASITLLAVFGDATEAVLRYERAALQNGEWWRWLTGHLVHLNFAHLILNLAGLLLCGLLVGAGLAGAQGLVMFGAAAVACSAGLWMFNPEIGWYEGLSGVLHGLLLGGALGLPVHLRRWRWMIGTIVIAKLLIEQVSGAALSTPQLIGHAVIVDAHLYGAVGGAAGYLLHRAGTYCMNRVVSRAKTHGSPTR